MKTVSVREVTTQLPALLALVQRGQEVLIANDGGPMARLCGVVATGENGETRSAVARRDPPAEEHGTELLARVKQAVRELEPGAEIVLFGSRTRGDARADSDWDFLILVDGPVDHQREETIWHRLYEVELDLDEVLSPIVYSHEEWESSRCRTMPLYENVKNEGKKV